MYRIIQPKRGSKRSRKPVKSRHRRTMPKLPLQIVGGDAPDVKQSGQRTTLVHSILKSTATIDPTEMQKHGRAEKKRRYRKISLRHIADIDSESPATANTPEKKMTLQKQPIVASAGLLFATRDKAIFRPAALAKCVLNQSYDYEETFLYAITKGNVVRVAAHVHENWRCLELLDASNCSVLHRAVMAGQVDVLAQLLTYKKVLKYINLGDTYGRTPLHDVFWSKQSIQRPSTVGRVSHTGGKDEKGEVDDITKMKMLRLLLQKGGKVCLMDIFGASPIYVGHVLNPVYQYYLKIAHPARRKQKHLEPGGRPAIFKKYRDYSTDIAGDYTTESDISLSLGEDVKDTDDVDCETFASFQKKLEKNQYDV